VDLCIGTRSAVFAPFKNLGLIVIDEEHEHTYKSEQTPKYHARDIARFRCARHNAVMLLSSATPSLESYYKAKSGKYTLISMTERYGKAALPETVICDLRLDASQGSSSPISALLEKEIEQTIEKKEQSILFLNRRGYNNYVSCSMCGEAIKCPHCSVSLTRHSLGRQNKEGVLVCHYCGYRSPIPEKCPACASKALNSFGFGTQRAEHELSELFPDANIMRMDADTTSSKYAFDRILDDFMKKKADILLGTQMVTKGHDFPNVTLVGVLLADSMLFSNDFRANERAFSMLTQVIGRAGRADKPGRAFIQTYMPEHQVLEYAADQDYISFYENEIATRRAFVFPPFCDIITVTFASAEEAFVNKFSTDFAKSFNETAKRDYPDIQYILFGPFESPIYKINEIYKKRIILKCKDTPRTRGLISNLLRDFSKASNRKINISVDVNPLGI